MTCCSAARRWWAATATTRSTEPATSTTTATTSTSTAALVPTAATRALGPGRSSPASCRSSLRHDLDLGLLRLLLGLLDREHGLQGADRDLELLVVGLARGQ